MSQDLKIKVYRPLFSLGRLNESGARLGFGDFDPKELYKCLCKLLVLQKEWIPQKKGYSLYIRPILFSTSVKKGLSSCILAQSESPAAHGC